MNPTQNGISIVQHRITTQHGILDQSRTTLHWLESIEQWPAESTKEKKLRSRDRDRELCVCISVSVSVGVSERKRDRKFACLIVLRPIVRVRVQEAGQRKANNQRRTQVVQQVSSNNSTSTNERTIWQDRPVIVR